LVDMLKPIYNINRFVLQCVGILLEGCLACEELVVPSEGASRQKCE